MRIAVTGGAGFIGARVVGRLKDRGHDVVSIGRDRGNDIVSDILDARSARAAILQSRATTLVHLAWSVKSAGYRSSPENARWSQASWDLARAFADSGGKAVIVAGTCLEYGAGAQHSLREADALAPGDAYALAKVRLFERLRTEIEADVRIGWARIFFPYGRGEPRHKVVSRLIDGITQGSLPRLDDPDRVIDYIHVDDVAEALVRMAESGVAETVNVGTGDGTTARAIARLIAERLRPEMLAQIDAMPAARESSPALVADVTHMHRRLGSWADVSMRAGIDSMLP